MTANNENQEPEPAPEPEDEEPLRPGQRRNWGGIIAVLLFVALIAALAWSVYRRERGLREARLSSIAALPDPSSPSSIFPKKVETREQVELFLDNARVLNALAQYGLATRGKAYDPEYLRGLTAGILPADVDGFAAYWDESTGYKDLIFCKKPLMAGSTVFYDRDGNLRLVAGCGNFYRQSQRNDAVTKPKKVCVSSRPRASTKKEASAPPQPCYEKTAPPHRPAPTPKPKPPPKEELGIAMAPQPSRVIAFDTGTVDYATHWHSTPASSMTYDAGSINIAVYRHSEEEVIPEQPSEVDCAEPNPLGDIDTDWCYTTALN